MVNKSLTIGNVRPNPKGATPKFKRDHHHRRLWKGASTEFLLLLLVRSVRRVHLTKTKEAAN